MSYTKILMITSCKGGVGKSTVSANLGMALASGGLKTLVVDCDFGIRSLDLILGVEDSVIYDVCDVMAGAIPADKAIVPYPGNDKLSLLAAPFNRAEDSINPDAFCKTINDIAERMHFDYILLDTPGEIGQCFRMAASVAQTALVVSTNQPTSIRAAERTGSVLLDLGVTQRRLLVNGFDFKSSGDFSLLGLIDETYLQLIGIIPFDSRVMSYQSARKLVFEIPDSNVPAAYRNLASRVRGIQLPLFTSFKNISREKLLKKIQ